MAREMILVGRADLKRILEAAVNDLETLTIAHEPDLFIALEEAIDAINADLEADGASK